MRDAFVVAVLALCTYIGESTAKPVPAFLPPANSSEIKLPRSTNVSDLIKRSKSTEAVELSYQGPAVEEVTSSNAKQEACPHKADGLEHWSNVTQWSEDTDTIEIPVGVKVLFSASDASETSELYPFPRIHIPATSELVFQDEDMEVFTNGISVDVGGALVVGAPSCKLQSQITITLCGGSRNQSADLGLLEDDRWKSIHVAGRLELHSVRYSSTWTRLALHAVAGDTSIVLQEPVNWEAGQQIVLTSTQVKDSRDWHRNEEHRIESVETFKVGTGNDTDSVFTLVTLKEPLKFTHAASTEYQAEVGLLSRRLVIQGDAMSEPLDNGKVQCFDEDFPSGYPCESSFLQGYGGHITISGSESIARVSGVELFRMGKTNMLSRYPMHFHMMQDGSDSYFEDSSVHKSYYRCVSIHGTNSSRVSRNVAFDVIGHCFYLEDGVEEGNLFDHNLGAYIHMIGKPAFSTGMTGEDYIAQPGTLETPVDVTASAFYISNGYNRFRGNAAVGGWSGFAFVELERPIGDHNESHVWLTPSRRPNLEFEGNTCHSSAYWWSDAGCVYAGGELKQSREGILSYNPFRKVGGRATMDVDAETRCRNDGDASCHAWQEFNNTKAFLCNHGLKHWGSRPTVRGFEVHDFTKYGVNVFGTGYVTGLLTVCRSSLAESVESHISNTTSTYHEKRFWKAEVFGFNWYDTGQRHILTNSTFRNCGDQTTPPSWAFRMPSQRDDSGPEAMSATRSIIYDNVPTHRILQFSSKDLNTNTARLNNWYDDDGSATLRGKPTLAGSSMAGPLWWNADPVSCEKNDDMRMYLCDTTPPYGIGSRVIASVEIDAFPGIDVGGTYCSSSVEKDGIPCPVIGYVNHFGSRAPIDQGLPLTFFEKITGIMGGFGWHFSFENGLVPKTTVFKRPQLPGDGWLVVALTYPKSVKVKATITKEKWCTDCELELPLASSYTDFMASYGAKYWRNKESGNVFLMIRPLESSKEKTFDFNFPARVNLPFEREGIRLYEKLSSVFSWKLTASCGAKEWYGERNFCSKRAEPVIPHEAPCELGQHIGPAIDSCQWQAS